MAFNPSRAMGISPQPYDQYFEPSPAESFSVSGVQSQPFAPVFGLSTYDPIEEQARSQQAQADYLKRQAQADILEGDTDWGSDEGRMKLQDYLARGVVSPTQARAMIYTVPKPNRYSNVPFEVAQALSPLNQLDPSDPEAMTQLSKIIGGVSPDVQTHPQFLSALQNTKKEILSQKQHREISGRHDPNEELIGKAMAAGVTPEELQEVTDENGQVTDRIGLRNLMFQAANAPKLDTDTAKHLSAMRFAALTPPDQDSKAEWLTANGIKPESATPEQWNAAWYGVRNGRQQAYNGLLQALEGTRHLPKPFEISQPQQTQGPIQVNSQEQYNALPARSVYVDSNGNTRRKG